mmetsp:Transcript_1652/g.2162  ORF Transcript_1652/g.2162 Transcript_1652/m.2162 type:complete len:88 (-) Transcript_1652:683-946(-)
MKVLKLKKAFGVSKLSVKLAALKIVPKFRIRRASSKSMLSQALKKKVVRRFSNNMRIKQLETYQVPEKRERSQSIFVQGVPPPLDPT